MQEQIDSARRWRAAMKVFATLVLALGMIAMLVLTGPTA